MSRTGPASPAIWAGSSVASCTTRLAPRVKRSSSASSSTWSHGYGIIDVTADAFTILIQEIPSNEVGTSYYDDPDALDDLFTPVMFTIRDGAIAPGP